MNSATEAVIKRIKENDEAFHEFKNGDETWWSNSKVHRFFLKYGDVDLLPSECDFVRVALRNA